MATYLLVWNPRRWEWHDLQEQIDLVRSGTPVVRRWSCGVTKKIEVGDQVFLMRLGEEPKGIFGSGCVTRSPYKDQHWDPAKAANGGTALFVMFKVDALRHPERESILDLEQLRNGEEFSGTQWDYIQASGIGVPDATAVAVEREWKLLVE